MLRGGSNAAGCPFENTQSRVLRPADDRENSPPITRPFWSCDQREISATGGEEAGIDVLHTTILSCARGDVYFFMNSLSNKILDSISHSFEVILSLTKTTVKLNRIYQVKLKSLHSLEMIFLSIKAYGIISGFTIFHLKVSFAILLRKAGTLYLATVLIGTTYARVAHDDRQCSKCSREKVE